VKCFTRYGSRSWLFAGLPTETIKMNTIKMANNFFIVLRFSCDILRDAKEYRLVA